MLLFVLGLVLIGLEIFVLPGFGVAGISGIMLIVFSLALVALEKRPQTSAEWLSSVDDHGPVRSRAGRSRWCWR